MSRVQSFADERGFHAVCPPVDAQLSLVDLKLLSSNDIEGLLPCAKSRFNGRLKFTYFTGERYPLSRLLPKVTPEQYLTIVANELKTVIRVEQNGFMDAGKLALGPDDVFVDPSTRAVGLIYVPVTPPVDETLTAGLYEGVCRFILDAVEVAPLLRGLEQDLAMMFRMSAGHLDELLRRVRECRPSGQATTRAAPAPAAPASVAPAPVAPQPAPAMPAPAPPPAPRPTPAPQVRQAPIFSLVGNTAGGEVSIPIAWGTLVLGKSVTHADVTIQGDPTVSNRHCEVRWDANGLSLTDLNSTNGTFVNGRELPSGGSVALHRGDVLQVGKMEFVLRAGE